MDDFESGHQVLTEPQAQSQSQLSLAGDCINAAFRNDKPVSMMDLLLNDVMLAQPQDLARQPVEDVQHAFDQPVCGAIAPLEPGSQTPDVTVGVALHLPPTIPPWDIQGMTASRCYPLKNLAEVSAGTTLTATSEAAAEDKQAPRRRRVRRTARANIPATELECGQCNRSFNCKKDLRRHQRSTKAHGAPEVAKCSCGKGVTRIDAMKSHRRFCRGTTLPPDGTTMGH